MALSTRSASHLQARLYGIFQSLMYLSDIEPVDLRKVLRFVAGGERQLEANYLLSMLQGRGKDCGTEVMSHEY
jgi:hypothetical protein